MRLDSLAGYYGAVRWLVSVIAVVAILALVGFFFLIPGASWQSLFSQGIPSAIVALIAIPIAYFLLFRHGLEATQLISTTPDIIALCFRNLDAGLDSEIDNLTLEQITSLRNEIGEQQRALQGKLATIEKTLEKVVDRRGVIPEELEKQSYEQAVRINHLRLAQLEAVQTKKKLSETQTLVSQLRAKIRSQSASLDQANKLLEDAKTQVSDLQIENRKLNEHCSAMLNKVASLEKDNEHSYADKTRLKAMEDEYRNLQITSAALQSENESMRQSLNTVLAEANKHTRTGKAPRNQA